MPFVPQELKFLRYARTVCRALKVTGPCPDPSRQKEWYKNHWKRIRAERGKRRVQRARKRGSAYKTAAAIYKRSGKRVSLKTRDCKTYGLVAKKVSRGHKSNTKLDNMRHLCARMDKALRASVPVPSLPREIPRGFNPVCARLRALAHSFVMNGISSPLERGQLKVCKDPYIEDDVYSSDEDDFRAQYYARIAEESSGTFSRKWY